jgi:catechol 2,3-dioxygenase
MSEAIDPGVGIGRVHLKVADPDRSLGFYHGVLGFQTAQRMGASAAFLSAGGYHRRLVLNAWESAGGSPPPLHSTGLYRLAIRYPIRRALADALRRLLNAGIRLDGASDHGVSEALYLCDPDQNDVELYRDRPKSERSRDSNGELPNVRPPARPGDPLSRDRTCIQAVNPTARRRTGQGDSS